jgi:hypothetical protein
MPLVIGVRTISSGDGYGVDVFRPVAAPGSRHLISPSASVDEALLKPIEAVGVLIASVRGGKHAWADVVELTFEIQFLLFADGEIAGPDPDQYAAELQCRKRGAEFTPNKFGWPKPKAAM